MARLLLLLAAVVVVFLLVKRLIEPSSPKPRDGGNAVDGAAATEDKLVRCVQCGAFIRRADALPDPAGFRCNSPECAKPG